MSKILVSLFFILAYTFAVRTIITGYKHPGNWSHNDLHFPYGGATVVVFLFPQVALLLLADHILNGTLKAIVLSTIGLLILVTATTLLVDFVHKKRLFKNDR